MVSALQGLRDVIVGTQSALLDAAVDAGRQRAVPLPGRRAEGTLWGRGVGGGRGDIRPTRLKDMLSAARSRHP